MKAVPILNQRGCSFQPPRVNAPTTMGECRDSWLLKKLRLLSELSPQGDIYTTTWKAQEHSWRSKGKYLRMWRQCEGCKIPSSRSGTMNTTTNSPLWSPALSPYNSWKRKGPPGFFPLWMVYWILLDSAIAPCPYMMDYWKVQSCTGLVQVDMPAVRSWVPWLCAIQMTTLHSSPPHPPALMCSYVPSSRSYVLSGSSSSVFYAGSQIDVPQGQVFASLLLSALWPGMNLHVNHYTL